MNYLQRLITSKGKITLIATFLFLSIYVISNDKGIVINDEDSDVDADNPLKIEAYYHSWAPASKQVSGTESIRFKTLMKSDYQDSIDTWFIGFLIPDKDGAINCDSIYPADLAALKDKPEGTTMLASIGGASANQAFADCLINGNHKTLAENCVAFVEKYDLDGLDVDFEPEKSIIDLNSYKDTFVEMIKEMRNLLGDDKYLTVTVIHVGACDANNPESKNALPLSSSAYWGQYYSILQDEYMRDSSNVNWYNLMNYTIIGEADPNVDTYQFATVKSLCWVLGAGDIAKGASMVNMGLISEEYDGSQMTYETLKKRIEFAMETGVRGMFIWSAPFDYNYIKLFNDQCQYKDSNNPRWYMSDIVNHVANDNDAGKKVGEGGVVKLTQETFLDSPIDFSRSSRIYLEQVQGTDTKSRKMNILKKMDDVLLQFPNPEIYCQSPRKVPTGTYSMNLVTDSDEIQLGQQLHQLSPFVGSCEETDEAGEMLVKGGFWGEKPRLYACWVDANGKAKKKKLKCTALSFENVKGVQNKSATNLETGYSKTVVKIPLNLPVDDGINIVVTNKIGSDSIAVDGTEETYRKFKLGLGPVRLPIVRENAEVDVKLFFEKCDQYVEKGAKKAALSLAQAYLTLLYFSKMHETPVENEEQKDALENVIAAFGPNSCIAVAVQESAFQLPAKSGYFQLDYAPSEVPGGSYVDSEKGFWKYCSFLENASRATTIDGDPDKQGPVLTAPDYQPDITAFCCSAVLKGYYDSGTWMAFTKNNLYTNIYDKIMTLGINYSVNTANDRTVTITVPEGTQEYSYTSSQVLMRVFAWCFNRGRFTAIYYPEWEKPEWTFHESTFFENYYDGQTALEELISYVPNGEYPEAWRYPWGARYIYQVPSIAHELDNYAEQGGVYCYSETISLQDMKDYLAVLTPLYPEKALAAGEKTAEKLFGEQTFAYDSEQFFNVFYNIVGAIIEASKQ